MKHARPLAGLVAIGALTIHCGDDSGSGGSGGGATTATVTSATSGPTTTTVAVTVAASTSASTTGVGGGSNVTCIDVENHPTTTCEAPDTNICYCNGCLPECDDGNGTFADCVCSVCAADPFCSNPNNCNLDSICDPFNEGCVCPDCAGHLDCIGQIEICDNGVDDNGNGLVDCEDAAFCGTLAVCQEPACMTATAIVDGDTMGDTTGGTSLLSGSCTGAGAEEVVYTYTPATDGYLVVNLASATDQGVHVRTTCTDTTSQVACVDAQVGGTDEHFAVDVTMGTPLTIIVDGFADTEAGPFTLSLTLVADGVCFDDMVCNAEVGEDCTCTDCTTSAVCGFCDMNMACDVSDACTCAECNMDAFCTDPLNCTDDGFCNQFIEGCQCADCAGLVPNCP